LLSLQVVADECETLYTAQPHCSEVVRTMDGLGFRLAGHVNCRFEGELQLFPGAKRHQFCEMDLLFLSKTQPPTDRLLLDKLYEYHSPHVHGCDATYRASLEESAAYARGHRLPPGKVVASRRRQGGVGFMSDAWEGQANTSFGRGYLCPARCFKHQKIMTDEDRVNVSQYSAHCPW
jgi:hypothetical protein